MTTEDAWFHALPPDDESAAQARITDGTAEEPADWPQLAVETGYAENAEAYYDVLRSTTLAAAEAAVKERERADDQQLKHAIRAMDDCERTANELAERVAEWAGTRLSDAGTGVEYARELIDGETADPADADLRSLAQRVVELAEEAAELRRTIETTAPDVAPNLSALAGPVLAARLVSLAGGLEALAKKPSGTVQVLGAEDALFAHLQGSAPSPKHGIIYTHEYVSGTDPAQRGSAARALAGKLTIAARIDHYSGDRRPELDAELDERIETIRSRGESA
ncbi:Archaeal nucleolar protein [Halorhabdus tiamatea SARL4B]|uniref:Archaeal nucleolar protein n=1 Tax=Halorhabdus tiamatea SARL4B TaxID=1033806 RepID=F7PH62_9EURY|nr:NOP58 family protein [Halorhabdus tiamatea]ERJ05633.1 Archaeal nucleolar protein [Halorhabdus tiamatea SARL4B]CCQ32479.1 rRNA biogenesis protein Nop5/Nop56 [Halorhabdus tiamatea SARL4B]